MFLCGKLRPRWGICAGTQAQARARAQGARRALRPSPHSEKFCVYCSDTPCPLVCEKIFPDQILRRPVLGSLERPGFMNKKAVVLLKNTPGGVFIPCPVCRAGKLMQIYPETAASGIGLYCRNCKQQSVIDIQPGEKLDRVTLRK